LYTETAMGYSVYQGCYDNLQKGGWEKLATDTMYSNGLALWSVVKYPNEDQFIGNLQESINASLELYRKSSYKFLSDYLVDMPSHTIIIKDYDSSSMSVTASSDRSFSIEKTQESGEYIRLEKESTIQNDDEYKVNCYGIYQKGMDVYAAERDIIQTFIDSISADPNVYNPQDFNSDIKKQILSTWGSEESVTWREDDQYLITAQVLNANLGQKTVGPEGNTYNADIKVKFEIVNETGNEFPVYDGSKVVFAPMKMVFVLSINQNVPLKRVIKVTVSPEKKVSASSALGYSGTYSYQEASECEGENCPEESMYIVRSFDEDNNILDEIQVPESEIESVVNDMREDGLTVVEEIQSQPAGAGGLSFSGEVLGLVLPKAKPVLVPPKGTEYLQRIVARYADLRGISRPLLFALVQQESRWKANARSRKGARGLMQVMPKTAGGIGWTQNEGSLYNPEINSKYGSLYFRNMLAEFGDERLALAAYNAGPTRVSKILDKYCKKNPTYDCAKLYLPVETLIYVPEITLRYKKLYAALPGIGTA
ncbi:MAG: transglycosylase SLT domain-containing protein, partial [Candidatus Aenigmarchaeota archaeon]|nr:transglycosylase SLT domain-containing protein [Candidatus Aenigmarchaeota archaeon]